MQWMRVGMGVAGGVLVIACSGTESGVIPLPAGEGRSVSGSASASAPATSSSSSGRADDASVSGEGEGDGDGDAGAEGPAPDAVCGPPTHACAPGEKEPLGGCDRCGRLVRYCTSTCVWEAACLDQGCEPGTVEYIQAGCPEGTYRTKVCQSDCTYAPVSLTCAPR